jgi:antitoxin HicB
MLSYQVKFDEPDDQGFVVVHFPDFEWGVTQGESEEEALEMAADVIEIYLAECIKKSMPLPISKKRAGKQYRSVRLPALVAAKAELYAAFLKAGVTKAELGRRLHMPRMNVDRLFDLHHHSRLDQIEAAFRAMGKELAITVHDAA